MTTGQKGALTGAALGTGIGAVAGASFPVVVGAGLIGGAAGYITGSAIDRPVAWIDGMIAKSVAVTVALVLVASASRRRWRRPYRPGDLCHLPAGSCHEP